MKIKYENRGYAKRKTVVNDSRKYEVQVAYPVMCKCPHCHSQIVLEGNDDVIRTFTNKTTNLDYINWQCPVCKDSFYTPTYMTKRVTQ